MSKSARVKAMGGAAAGFSKPGASQRKYLPKSGPAIGPAGRLIKRVTQGAVSGQVGGGLKGLPEGAKTRQYRGKITPTRSMQRMMNKMRGGGKG